MSDRAIWFDGYVRTYLERDLQVLSAIAALPDFRRLMRATAFRLGQLVNQTELGPRRGIAATDSASVPEPSGDLVPARASSCLRCESHQTAHQVT